MPTDSSPRLLLTSVCRPFGGPGEGDSVGAELYHAQVTRAQGPFSLRQTIRVWALDYIAENVLAPTVTLHYPSRGELIRELRQGDYTHVGINFVVATFHKVCEMVPLVREHAPDAKIVLGGYGTVLPDEVLAPFADAICRQEGIGFMRELLGEPAHRPIRHPHAPTPSVNVLLHQLPTVVGHVTAGLGCPNGCDFCCTSHFYDREYVRLAATGRDVYEALMRTRDAARRDGVCMSGFTIIDEDFFLHHARARQFLDCVREGGESLSIFGFGSVRGLSRFTAEEIAEMGFDLVWNGFEGTRSGYRKQRGRTYGELYRELKSVGCAQLTSMIIGFPYQDEAVIRRELEDLLALEPAMVQCLIYFAFPGTPLHTQVISEGRYRERYRGRPDLRRWDGFAMHFDHPHFSRPERVEEIQREIYREDFERLGPTPLRLARVWLTGYEHLKNHENPLLAQRAERLRRDVRGLLPVCTVTERLGPSPRAKERAAALRRDIERLTGAPSARERALMELAPVGYLAARAALALGVLQQPGLLRTEHRTRPEAAATRHTAHAMKLQGARTWAPRALVEDVLARARTMLRGPSTPGYPDAIDVVTREATKVRRLPVVQDVAPAPLPRAV